MTVEVDTLTARGVRTAALWDHQARAAARAQSEPGFLLAHEMGTGKTRTAITLLEHDRAHRVLVLCPRNVVGVWPAELARHAPRQWRVWAGRVQGQRGPKRSPSVEERAAALVEANAAAIRLGQPFAAVVNYEASYLGSMRELLLGTEWDAVICDESHRCKAPAGKASRLASTVAGLCRKRRGRVLCLTGTPMPHSPLDLWAQMRIVDGGQRLGRSYHAFQRRYAQPEEIWIGQGQRKTIYRHVPPEQGAELAQAVAPTMDRVAAADVLDLPEAVDRHVDIQLDPATQRAYGELERHGIHEAQAGTLTAANAMVLMLRLAQVTSGFGRDVESDEIIPLTAGTPEKARALADLLEDLPQREPVVVFARFHADLDAIQQVCEEQGRSYGELSGRAREGLTADDPPRMSEGIDVLGAQLQSGGLGIDLTRARIGVFYGLDFRLADYQQSRARLVRPGQDRPVVFAHLAAEGTVDEVIARALEQRQEVIDQVMRHLTEAGNHEGGNHHAR